MNNTDIIKNICAIFGKDITDLYGTNAYKDLCDIIVDIYSDGYSNGIYDGDDNDENDN